MKPSIVSRSSSQSASVWPHHREGNSMKRILQMSGIVVGMALLVGLGWQLSGCLPGNPPSLTDYCRAYKACKCRNLFGDDLNNCGSAVDQETSNPPGGRDKDDWCRDLFETTACYQPYPNVDPQAVGFGTLRAPKLPAGWVRGKCAGAIACCLQIQMTTDRRNCLDKFDGVDDENRCVQLAAEAGVATQGCDATKPGGKTTPPPRPQPEPAPEPTPSEPPTSPESSDAGDTD